MTKKCSQGDCSCLEPSKLNCSEHTASVPTKEENKSSSDFDDVWDSSSDNGDVTESRDLAALKRRHENRGYLDGLTKGGESGLQAGFDDGYPLGAQIGGIVGELIADTIWRSSLGQITPEVKNNVLSELKIEKVLSSEYFDTDLNMKNPHDHPIINKWVKFFDTLGPPL